MLKHRQWDRVDTTCVVPCSEKALPKLLLDIVVFGKQQISGAVQVRELLEEQGYPSTSIIIIVIVIVIVMSS